MKKILIILIGLVLIFIPATTVFAEWGGTDIVEEDGQYTLSNTRGNSSCQTSSLSDRITTQTSFDFEIKLLTFSSAIFPDILNINLTTAEGNGLLLSFSFEITQETNTPLMTAKVIFDDISTSVKFSGFEIKEQTLSIKAVYVVSGYEISVNGQTAFLAVDKKAQPAALSIEIICSDPTNETRVVITKTKLDIAEKEESVKGDAPEKSEEELKEDIFTETKAENFWQAEAVRSKNWMFSILIGIVPILLFAIRVKLRNK